jgi:small-conductance mechanosensitive channel
MPGLDSIADLLRQREVFGNTLQRWLIALAVAAVAGLALGLAKRLLAGQAATVAQKRAGQWLGAVADLVRQTKGWFLLVLALYCGSLLLVLPDKAAQIVASAAIIALLVQAALWGDALLTAYLRRLATRRVETDAAGATTLVALGFLTRLTVWAMAALLVLANLGINITAMVAGLGIGGVAVALAAQNILGDLFASASIVLDKPFVLQDFIVVGEDMGTVEHIGLKTTRVRSLSGEQLIFANSDLLRSRIRNFQRMNQRRVVFTIGVTYQTPPAKLAAIGAMLRQAVEAQSPTRFDRAHFKQYGDSALIFEVVYYVLSADYNLYMDVQQAINLAIFQRFADERIAFAYPTQTVYLQK